MLQCYNRGCGKEYAPENNKDGKKNLTALVKGKAKELFI